MQIERGGLTRLAFHDRYDNGDDDRKKGPDKCEPHLPFSDSSFLGLLFELCKPLSEKRNLCGIVRIEVGESLFEQIETMIGCIPFSFEVSHATTKEFRPLP